MPLADIAGVPLCMVVFTDNFSIEFEKVATVVCMTCIVLSEYPTVESVDTTYTVTGSFLRRHFAAGGDAISPSYLRVTIS